jgi:hypothetical protein
MMKKEEFEGLNVGDVVYIDLGVEKCFSAGLSFAKFLGPRNDWFMLNCVTVRCWCSVKMVCGDGKGQNGIRPRLSTWPMLKLTVLTDDR